MPRPHSQLTSAQWVLYKLIADNELADLGVQFLDLSLTIRDLAEDFSQSFDRLEALGGDPIRGHLVLAGQSRLAGQQLQGHFGLELGGKASLRPRSWSFYQDCPEMRAQFSPWRSLCITALCSTMNVTQLSFPVTTDLSKY